jgi:phage recombination protein Bet
MTFQCKQCGNDVEPAQAKQTYDEFGQAMCKGCTEKYLNDESNVRESKEDEATTPTETLTTPANGTMEQADNKSSEALNQTHDKPLPPTPRRPPQHNVKKMDNSDLTKENVRQYLCPSATDQELFMFLQLCEHRKLNPFIKEAYLVKYNNSPATLIVGKDAFTKKAEEHPEFNGFEAGVIIEKEDVIEYRPGQLVRKGEDLIGGWAQVHRKDRQYPYRSEVSMQEYNTGQSSWKKLPATMIRKVALVQALREAFPSDLGGCYDSAEMGVQ